MPLFIRSFYACCLALALSFGAGAQDDHNHDHEDHGPSQYEQGVDAAAVIDAALARAGAENKQALILFGADWCHDSRGLASTLETDPVLSELVDERFVLARIDVGTRHLNQDQLQRFGLMESFGTPTVVIADAEGQSLNGLAAHDWRAADNYSVGDIAVTLSRYGAGAAPEGAYYAVDVQALLSDWDLYKQALIDIEALDAQTRARTLEYMNGMARSLIRYAMGEHTQESGEALVFADDLTGAGLEPVADRTEAVRAQMEVFDFNLLTRLAHQDEERQEVLAEAEADFD